MIAILVSILGLAAPGPSPSPPTLHAQLQGTWRIVSHELRDNANQAWTRRFGDHPKGYIMYDATGHMMVGF